jgi:hypothetical protein
LPTAPRDADLLIGLAELWGVAGAMRRLVDACAANPAA